MIQKISYFLLLVIGLSVAGAIDSANAQDVRQVSLAPGFWTVKKADGRLLDAKKFVINQNGKCTIVNTGIEPFIDVELQHEFSKQFSFSLSVNRFTVEGATQAVSINASGYQIGLIESEGSKWTYLYGGHNGQKKKGLDKFDVSQQAHCLQLVSTNNRACLYFRNQNDSPLKLFFRIAPGTKIELNDKLELSRIASKTSPKVDMPIAKQLGPHESEVKLPFVVSELRATENEKFLIASSCESRQVVIVDNVAQKIVREWSVPGSGCFQFGANNEHVYIWAAATNSIVKYDLSSGDSVAENTVSTGHHFDNLIAGSRYLLASGHSVGEPYTAHLFDAESMHEIDLQVPEYLFLYPTNLRYLRATTNPNGLQHFLFDYPNIVRQGNSNQRRTRQSGIDWTREAMQMVGRTFSIVESDPKSISQLRVSNSTNWYRHFVKKIRIDFWPVLASRRAVDPVEVSFEIKIESNPFAKLEPVSNTGIRARNESSEFYDPVPLSQRFIPLLDLNQLAFLPDECNRIVYREYGPPDFTNSPKMNVFIAKAEFPGSVVPGQKLRVPLQIYSRHDKLKFVVASLTRPSRSSGSSPSKSTGSDTAKVENGIFIWDVPESGPRIAHFEIQASQTSTTVSDDGRHRRVTKDFDNLGVSIAIVDPETELAGVLRIRSDLYQAPNPEQLANHKMITPVSGSLNSTERPTTKETIADTKPAKPNPIVSSIKVSTNELALPSRTQQVSVGGGGRYFFYSLDGDNREIHQLDVESGKVIKQFTKPGGDVLFATGKNLLVFYDGSSGGTKVVNFSSGESNNYFFPVKGIPTSVVMGRDDDRFIYIQSKVTLSSAPNLFVIDLADEEPEKSMQSFSKFFVGDRTVPTVSADGRHLVNFSGLGLSYRGKFETWHLPRPTNTQSRTIFQDTYGISFDGELVFGMAGLFQNNRLIESESQLRIPDNASSYYCVPRRNDMVVRKPGVAVDFGSLPIAFGNSGASTMFGMRRRVFLDLKRQKVIVFPNTEKPRIEIHSFDREAFFGIASIASTNLDFETPPAFVPGETWSMKLNKFGGSDTSSDGPTMISSPSGATFKDGEVVWDVPASFKEPMVPFAFDTADSSLPQVSFFAKRDGLVGNRDVIVRSQPVTPRPPVPEKRLPQFSRTRSPVSELDYVKLPGSVNKVSIGGGGNLWLIRHEPDSKPRSSQRNLSIIDVDKRAIVYDSMRERSDIVAIGSEHCVFTEEFSGKNRLQSIKLNARARNTREMKQRISFLAMGQDSDRCFAYWTRVLSDDRKVGVLAMIDAGSLETIAETQISCVPLVTGIHVSGDGATICVQRSGSEIRRVPDVDFSNVNLIESPKPVQFNFDGSIAIIDNQVFDKQLNLIDSFPEDKTVTTTPVPGAIGLSSIENGIQSFDLVHVETGRPFYKQRFPISQDVSPATAASFIQWRILTDQVARISDDRLLIETLAKPTDGLGAFPVFLSQPPVHGSAGTVLRYQPIVQSRNYPIQVSLTKGPEQAVLADGGILIWNPVAGDEPHEFRIRARDVLGRESIQSFHVLVAE